MKTDIFPPVKIGKHRFSIGRAIRFLLGVSVISYTAFFWDGTWQEAGVRYILGIALIDITLLTEGVSAWKSRNGH